MSILATAALLLAILALALFALIPRKAGSYRPEHSRLAVASASASILSVLSVALRLLAA